MRCFDSYDIIEDAVSKLLELAYISIRCGPPYLTLPYLAFGAGAQGTPALGPQFGSSAQPRQTSWSKKSPRGFCKPQENCPVDTIKNVQ